MMARPRFASPRQSPSTPRAHRRPVKRDAAPPRAIDEHGDFATVRERLARIRAVGSPGGTEVRTALRSRPPLGCPNRTRTDEVRTWGVIGTERFGDANPVISG